MCISTTNPTRFQTLEPTVQTLNPTLNPTMREETQFVQILGLSRGPASTSLCFSIGSCRDPTITVEYLPIDYDSSNEYIHVCYLNLCWVKQTFKLIYIICLNRYDIIRFFMFVLQMINKAYVMEQQMNVDHFH